MHLPDLARQTYRREQVRAVATGINETANTTFLLLIAVRWFDASPTSKACLAAASSFGHVLSTLFVHLAAKFRMTSAQSAALLLAFASIGYALTILVDSTTNFVLWATIATALFYAVVPFITTIFQTNYPPTIRGRLYSRTQALRILTSIVAAKVIGDYLNTYLYFFPILIVLYSLSALISSYALLRCPSIIFESKSSNNPFSAFRFLKKDRIFRNTLIAWMFLGFGNLMMRPLRIEYLSNSDYQLDLSTAQIALLVGVLPQVARLVVSPIWGILFDRLNFFALRIIINIVFALGILTFFMNSSITGLIIAAVIYGVAESGGDLAWMLWVTKFAPSEHTAEYMSVHVSLTGVRGILAPFAGFYLIQYMSLSNLALLSMGLIGISIILFFAEYRIATPATSSTVI